jgi:hypothetical protein
MGLFCHNLHGLGNYLFGVDVIPAATASAKLEVQAVEGEGVHKLVMVTLHGNRTWTYPSKMLEQTYSHERNFYNISK